MAKKKIVVRMSMDSNKRRSRALFLAANIHGVESTAINKDNGELTVIGEGIDAVEVTKVLRSGKPRFMCLGGNGMGWVELISVGEDKKEEDKKKPEEEVGKEWCHNYYGGPYQYQWVEVPANRGCWW